MNKIEIAICNSGYHDRLTGIIPYGTLSVVAALESGGYQVHFADYQTADLQDKPSPKTYAEFLRRLPHRFIGVNGMCGNLPTVLEGIALLKKSEPDRFVIFGGPAASPSAVDICRHYPVDVVVRGEAERTMVELADRLSRGRDIDVDGVTFFGNGEIVSTPDRRRIEDLDSLPLPQYDRLDLDHYLPIVPVVSARGCPYKCAFCGAHVIWQRRLTQLSPGRVVEYVASAPSILSHIEFQDDVFLLNVDRCFQIISGIRDAGVDSSWTCQGRVDLMTPELLESLAEKGCRSVMYGIESGSDRVLARINKQFSSEQARRVIKWTLDTGMRAQLSFMWGFPFETMDDFQETLMAVAEAQRHPHCHAQLYLFNPLPGAPLTEECWNMLDFSLEEADHFNVSMLPSAEYRLADFPDLKEAIIGHPELYSSFYYLNYPGHDEKSSVMKRFLSRWRRSAADAGHD